MFTDLLVKDYKITELEIMEPKKSYLNRAECAVWRQPSLKLKYEFHNLFYVGQFEMFL